MTADKYKPLMDILIDCKIMESTHTDMDNCFNMSSSLWPVQAAKTTCTETRAALYVERVTAAGTSTAPAL